MFCANCGEELSTNANFCFNCGVMTRIGAEAGLSYPWNWEKEMERTFSTAAREMEKAFVTVKDNIRKTIKREPILCPYCNKASRYGSKFCYSCGKELKAS